MKPRHYLLIVLALVGSFAFVARAFTAKRMPSYEMVHPVNYEIIEYVDTFSMQTIDGRVLRYMGVWHSSIRDTARYAQVYVRVEDLVGQDNGH